MKELILIVGLPKSGKTSLIKEYYALTHYVISEQLIKDKYKWINKDKISIKIVQLIKEIFKTKDKIVIDAENLTIKSRARIISNLFTGKDKLVRENISIAAEVLNTPYEECKNRAQNEEELNNLDRKIRKFQVPFDGEGFDRIGFWCEAENGREHLSELMERAKTFDQKNKNHSKLLFDHMYAVNSLFNQKLFIGWRDLPLNIGMTHDIGKLFTQTIREDGNAHYYNHENIGAYVILENYQDDREYLASVIANYHMLPYRWDNEKTRNKWKKIFGNDLFELLVEFNKCDRLGK